MRESFIKSDLDARELKLAIAVRMAFSGNIYHEISKILGVSNFGVAELQYESLWDGNLFKFEVVDQQSN